jgi:hypothetical protein
MKTGPAGLALIEQFEGLELEAYQDLVGVWTIGYGHTRGVRPGQTVTKAEAEALLQQDLAAAEAAVIGDYNTIDPNVSANYSVGAHDTTGADAALDSDDFPTASGNCDGNGDPSLVDWVGDRDPFGLTLIYKSSAISRGARTIPAIYAGAVIQPDLW